MKLNTLFAVILAATLIVVLKTVYPLPTGLKSAAHRARDRHNALAAYQPRNRFHRIEPQPVVPCHVPIQRQKNDSL